MEYLLKMKALIKYIDNHEGYVDTIKVTSFDGVETHIKVVGNSRARGAEQREFYNILTELINESN